MPRKPLSLQALRTWSLGMPVAQCRVVPVRLGSGRIDGIAVAHTTNVGSNPWYEMFSFPTDTQKLAVFDLEGRRLWQRDLGEGVVPDPNFCPMMPMDLDGDGVDELYFVNNIDPEHPLGHSKYRLERVDIQSGEATGQWPWPRRNSEGSMVNAFRNCILAGFVRGKPVLVTAQGTYADMYIQCWNPDLTARWEVTIAADSPGARGSHMHPVVDLNGDGVDELLWGERCIELNEGRELFCADRDSYSGHSDLILPFLDLQTGRWLIYTAREKQNHVSPRVAVFDAQGQRVWGDVDRGHMHTGWLARLDPDRLTALATRVGGQVQTRQGRKLFDAESFAFDAHTGERLRLPFDTHHTIPVDLNGDGLHELVRGTAHDPLPDGEVLDGEGCVLGRVGGPIALASKIIDHPGEQVLTYARDGTLRLWADANAEDCDAASRRYQHAYYQMCQRLTGQGNHLFLLGGI